MSIFVRIEELREIATVLAPAIDSNDINGTADCLELKAEGTNLHLIIAGYDYHVEAIVPIYESSDFHATVNAPTLLKLIQKTTTPQVEFSVDDKILIMKGNGTYKLPLIYDNDEMLSLPDVPIEQVNQTLNYKYEVLESINTYNSKELAKAKLIVNPIQKLYYVDEKGCVTFTTGACVNRFESGVDVKFFLSSKIVGMLKLFKKSEDVQFTLGTTDVEGFEQIRYCFESDNFKLICIQPQGEFESFPVNAVRNMTKAEHYPNTAYINKTDLLNALDRMEVINGVVQPVKFTFGIDKTLTMTSNAGGEEELDFKSDAPVDYEFSADMTDLKLSIDRFSGVDLEFSFGNESSIMITQGRITFIVPEVL